MKTKTLHLLLAMVLLFACNTNQEVVEININKRRIELGDTVKIDWNIEGKKLGKINMHDFKDSLKKVGKMQFIPDKTTKIQFEIERKKDKPIKKTYSVEVLPPKINYFRGPKFVTDEDYFIVKWGVENVQSVEIVGIRDWLGKQGELKVRLDSTMDLTLKVTNKFGHTAKRSIPIEVKILESFDAPDEIYIGEKAAINWKFKLTNKVTINDHPTAYNAADTLFLELEKDTVLIFKLHKKNGTIQTKQHTIKVLPPDILYFSSPKSVSLGGEAKLTWNTKGAKSIRIEGIDKDLPPRGQLMVSPTRSKSYKLTIKRDDLKKSKYTNIKVVRNRKFVDGVIDQNKNGDKRIDLDIFDVDYSNYPNKVTFKAIAVNSNKQFVVGLAKDKTANFPYLKETVQGKQHAITNFSVTEKHNKLPIPYDIALSLDYTGSLHDAIEKLESGVKSFINKKDDNDQMAIVKFNDTIITQVQLTKDKQALIQNGGFNGKINLDGNTALYAGADRGIKELNNASNQKLLLLFADGHENASFVYYNDHAVTASDLIKKAREMNVKIHVIAYGDQVNSNLLNRISQLTGGNFYEINSAEDIENVFKELSYVLRNYYEITYKPIDKDGVHKIDLTYKTQGANHKENATFFIGDKFDISNYEYVENTYWSKYCTKELRPLSAPQAAAFFHFDKSELDAVYKPMLKKYADYLSQNKDIQIVVFGHTDLKGSKSYCLELSKQRAEIVKRVLVEYGISASRFKIVAQGQNNPVWEAEEFEWQERENRRIEILLLTKKQP